MKRIILAVFAIAATASVATAQAQKPGSILVYGNLNFNSLKVGSADALNSWNIAPGVGYQFNKNMTAGLAFRVSQFDIDPVTKETGVGVGAFFRHHIPLNQTFFVFHQTSVGITSRKVDVTGGPSTDAINGVRLGWFPAVGINLNKVLALNFDLGGLSIANEKVASTNITEVGLDFGQAFNIGISANFGGSHAKKKQTREPKIQHKIDLNDEDEG